MMDKKQMGKIKIMALESALKKTGKSNHSKATRELLKKRIAEIKRDQ
jgi:hypothetical protein